MSSSNCCGAEASYLSDELCSECLEHAEFNENMSNELKTFLDRQGFTKTELEDIEYVADKCSDYNEDWSNAECVLRAIAYLNEEN